MLREYRSLFGAAVLASILTGCALGQSIPVINFDFEDPTQADGGYTFGGVPGWTGTAVWGVFRPTISTWGYVPSLHNQLLYLNGGTATQVLTDTLQANTTYTLLADVVNRPNYGVDYMIELLAGNTVIASDMNSVSPLPGQFATASCTFQVFAGDPNIGQALSIRLTGHSLQTNFDNVRLQTPSPGTLIALASGAGITLRRRRLSGH